MHRKNTVPLIVFDEKAENLASKPPYVGQAFPPANPDALPPNVGQALPPGASACQPRCAATEARILESPAIPATPTFHSQFREIGFVPSKSAKPPVRRPASIRIPRKVLSATPRLCVEEPPTNPLTIRNKV
jgi:hypothetical protein